MISLRELSILGKLEHIYSIIVSKDVYIIYKQSNVYFISSHNEPFFLDYEENCTESLPHISNKGKQSEVYLWM